MRIQHNIMAMNAYRNYNTNTSALSKNLEKLSSGYRINRAGDDAAGLAISEKMRAQITGLNAAQKNVKDGISLVKTAEGAMQEIQDMLNRMDYLATQSANGTYDNEVDRLNLQKEVDALKTEINRIADSANFNGIKLLDGSMDKNVKSVTDTVTTITGGVSNVSILQEAATDPTADVGNKTVLREPSAPAGKTTIQMELGDVTLTGQTRDTFTVKVGDAEIKLKVTADGANVDELESGKSYTGKALADKIANAFQAQGGQIQKQAFTATATVDANGNASVKFEQVNEPTTKDEVVGTNVAVDFSFKRAPDGHATDYTLEIGNEDIADGDFISIGGIKTEIDTDLETTFGAAANPNGVKVGDYNVKYANDKLTITDTDGTAGTPEVKYDSYSEPVKLDPVSTKGEDAVKAAYTVKVNTSGIYSKGESQVYSSQISVTTDFSGAVKQSNTFKIAVGTAFVDGDKLSITSAGGTAVDLEIGAGKDISVADANDTTKLAAAIAAKASNSTDYDVVADGDTITMTAKVAGAVGGAGGAGKPPAAAASLTLTKTGTGAATATGGTAVTGKAADTIAVGNTTLTVGDTTAYTPGTSANTGTITAADANDATKLAAIVADILNKEAIAGGTPNYTITSNGDKVVYTANNTGEAGIGNAPAAITAAPIINVTGGTVTAGAISTDSAGVDPDKISIGGVDLVVGTDISVADASNANKLAEKLAEKLNADTTFEPNYTITAKDGSLVFTANNGGEVGGVGNGPADEPSALTATITTKSTSGNKGALSFGNVTESTKGTDATKSYSEYDLSSLKAGDILTVNDKEFVVSDNGAIGDAADGTTFLAAVEGQAGVSAGGATLSADGKLKIEADKAGSNEAAPKATIRVKTKGETDATSQLDTPAAAESIKGTWNVQSTVNKEGGPTNPSALASTAFTLDSSIVKDGNTLTIGKDTYVFKVGADSTTEAADGQKLIDLSALEADDANLIKEAATALSNITDNSAFTIGYDEKATGDAGTAKITIHEKMGQTDYDKELMSVEEFDKLVYMSSPEVTTTEEVTTGFDGKPLTLQIGDTSDTFNQMQVSIGDMHVAAMGKGKTTLNGEEVEVTKTIADIDIGTLEGAQEAVAVIKNAINYVSSVRGDLGATQNRLEHTANNLSVMAENIQDAESTIRDTDVAEEMMAYTKNNILVQSAQAMLAQANAVPQGVLQLLG